MFYAALRTGGWRLPTPPPDSDYAGCPYRPPPDPFLKCLQDRRPRDSSTADISVRARQRHPSLLQHGIVFAQRGDAGADDGDTRFRRAAGLQPLGFATYDGSRCVGLAGGVRRVVANAHLHRGI